MHGSHGHMWKAKMRSDPANLPPLMPAPSLPPLQVGKQCQYSTSNASGFCGAHQEWAADRSLPRLNVFEVMLFTWCAHDRSAAGAPGLAC